MVTEQSWSSRVKPNGFRSLAVTNWRQFRSVDLNLENKVTIVTGENGCGKTTLLRILAYFLGEQFPFLSTPSAGSQHSGLQWLSGIWGNIFNPDRGNRPESIGSVLFESESAASLAVPHYSGDAAQMLTINNRPNLPGYFIPSHRPTFTYSPIGQIPLARTPRRGAHTAYLGQIRGGNPATALKNTLLNWGYVGFASDVNDGDPELRNNFIDFQEKLKTVLPSYLGFKRYEIRSQTEIVFVCEGTDFILETASGGITSLIHLAWTLFNYENGPEPFTVLIDEIENHLHPSLQRIVLTNLSQAFPTAKFIVATHSPFVVNSVRDATIYALSHDPEKKVVSRRLDFKRDAQTANEILDRVLGVPTTIPPWAESQFNRIVDKYLKVQSQQLDLAAFRQELEAEGLRAFTMSGLEALLKDGHDKS